MLARIACVLALLVLGAAPGDAARTAEVAPEPAKSLAGKLLVASPELTDPNFRHAVIFVLHHDTGGAMGLVINRVMATGPIGKLFQGLGVAGAATENSHQVRLHYGGPVNPGSSFVLHSRDYHGGTTLDLPGDVAMSASEETLKDAAAGKGPTKSLVILGYAGWAPGQVEREITTGSWVVVDGDPEFLFDDEVTTKWERAIARQGYEL